MHTIRKDWKKTLLHRDATLQQAIQCLNDSGMQIVLVVSQQNTLIGTLTDGDIRRALLKGLTLQSMVIDIVQTNPLVVPSEMENSLVLQLMQANRMHQVPVVDSNRRVKGLHLWDEIITPTSRHNTMIIMAGGKGTRLRPYTETCPKPMLEISGRPMLQHIIERAKADGFANFVIAIHYLGQKIVDYFGDGSRLGIKIEYLREDHPLGTAGALSLMSKRPDAPFVVTNGDVITDIHYGEILEFHLTHSATATMAVRQYELQNQYGVVKINGIEIAGFEEKPVYRSHINAGIYVLNPESLDLLNPGQRYDMPKLFKQLQDDGKRTIVYPMHESWIDVGRPDDLAVALLRNQ